MPHIDALTASSGLPAQVRDAVRRERLLRQAAEAANRHDTLAEAAEEVMGALVGRMGGWDAAHLSACTEPCITCARQWAFHNDVEPEQFADLVAASDSADAVAPDVYAGFLQSGTVLWLADVSEHPVPRRYPQMRTAGVRTAVGVPILIGDVVAARVELFSRAPRPMDADEARTLTAIGSMLGRVIERERAAADRAIALERLAAVTRTAPAAVVTLDGRGVITGWNQAATDMFGWSEQEMVGATPQRLFPAAHAREYSAGLLKVATGHGPDRSPLDRSVPVEGVHQDGSTVLVDANVGSWREDGELHFSIFLRDRGPREAAEAAMRQRDAVLLSRRHAVELNDSVIQGLVIAGYLLDEDEVDQARTVLADTLRTSRRMVGNLLEAGPEPDAADAAQELADQLRRTSAADPSRDAR